MAYPHRYASLVMLSAALTTGVPLRAQSSASLSAADRLQVPGPEEEELKRRVGIWNVTISFWAAPGAQLQVTTGVVAERSMVGLYLEEVMKPAAGAKMSDFRRISYTYYSRVEGRWQYVSLDTRLPVGIMPAFSFGKETGDKLLFQFESLGFVGLGRDVEGRMVRSNYEITRESNDHEFARQYWIASDGTAREWLAVQYEYRRIR